MMPEISNPLINARVIGADTHPHVYHDLGGKRGELGFIMSKSQLFSFNQCPQRWLAGYESKDTDASEWGVLMDILYTSPNLFDQLVAVCPASYPAEGKKGEPPVQKPWTFQANYCKDWKLDQGDKLIVKSDDYRDAKYAVEKLFKDNELAALIRESQKQVLVRAEYRDKETGIVVPLKCLIDLVPSATGPFKKSLCDFKTCTTGFHDSWAKTVFERGYHWQAALYLDAFTAATGEDRIEFRHIIQESFPPWQTTKELLSEEYVQAGRLSYLNALREYCQCLQTGVWPGYRAQTVINGWNLTEMKPWMVLS